MKIKKNVVFILTILAVLLLLTGCLNYKPYAAPAEEDNTDDLLSEIAEIEKELALAENEPTNELTGETITETGETITETEEINLPLDEESDYSNLQKITVKENEIIDLQVNIKDPDADNVAYSFSLPLNEQGKWKTNYGDAGEYIVTLTATDGKLTSTKDILLIVEKVNVPPIIKALKDIEIKEGDTFNVEPQVIDPNGDSVSVTISEPLTDGAWITDHTSAGEYEIMITASDGELDQTETFILKVIDVNVLPEITGLKDLIVNEGDTVEIKPEVTDLDNDKITLTISDPVGNDGVWKTSFTDHGTYTITVTANDGKDTVTKTITLEVKDVNMPPEIIDIILG